MLDFILKRVVETHLEAGWVFSQLTTAEQFEQKLRFSSITA